VQVPPGEQVPEQQGLSFGKEFTLKKRKATRSRVLKGII